MSNIVYDYFGGLYINLTNKCPCACEFCIKNFTDGLGTADSLLLEREPSVEEVLDELKNWNIDSYDEVVFCGYGEPTERLDDLLSIARDIKAKHDVKIRINTIGLADLRYGRDTTPELEGVIDAVNVSMNEADSEHYEALCHPEYGADAYPAMLDYIKRLKKHVPHVTASVVRGSLSQDAINVCTDRAAELGIGFRVR
ncbi:MAG: TatD family nuclease-associated radical SAM protein [Eubacteriaceae bacterium]|nr:TatD family nuclease-associated radical SAM protein [Eubacteriaceae bacterium]